MVDDHNNNNEESNDSTKTRLLNATVGIASTVIATMLIGLYVQIGSSAQELIRLQEQVKALQGVVSQYNQMGIDVKALQIQTDSLNRRIERMENKPKGS